MNLTASPSPSPRPCARGRAGGSSFSDPRLAGAGGREAGWPAWDEARILLANVGGGIITGEAMRILVVEDDNKIASFVVNGLKQSGFAVDHRANGEEALALARSAPYDAAVVDIMLPKLDGLS